MAIMAAVLMAFFQRNRRYLDKPLMVGLAFGLITYGVMNWLVVPLRFDTPLPPKTRAIVTQVFAHIGLVGIPMALVARRYLRRT
jgi:hypothetical protein